MEREDKRTGASRRGFLRLAGFGSVAAGAALVTGNDTAEAAEAKPGPNAAGYRETPHVKKVYEVSRF